MQKHEYVSIILRWPDHRSRRFWSKNLERRRMPRSSVQTTSSTSILHLSTRVLSLSADLRCLHRYVLVFKYEKELCVWQAIIKSNPFVKRRKLRRQAWKVSSQLPDSLFPALRLSLHDVYTDSANYLSHYIAEHLSSFLANDVLRS